MYHLICLSITILRASAGINNWKVRLLAIVTKFLFLASISIMIQFLATIAFCFISSTASPVFLYQKRIRLCSVAKRDPKG